jgi:hypothetical protein
MSEEETTRVFRKSRLESSEDTKATTPLFDGRTEKNKFSDDDPHTKIFRPSKTKSNSASNANDTDSDTSDEFATEPVVGWLVVLDGPGKGNFAKLGFGMNSIGRGEDSRVVLDYGDGEISRSNHAFLTYDSKNRKFFIQHGGGANLTYIGELPLLQPIELESGQIISIGNTKLSFISFCGPNFNWE